MKRLAVALALLVGTGAACRMGDPGDDPRTPANVPVPVIDRKDPDPARSPGDAPSLFGKDAG